LEVYELVLVFGLELEVYGLEATGE